MKLRYLSLLLPFVLAACGSESEPSSGEQTPDEINTVSIQSLPTEIVVGDSFAIRATAKWDSGKTEDVTGASSWSVSPSDAAQVSNSQFTAMNYTDAGVLSVSYKGFTDKLNFKIDLPEPIVEGIKISGLAGSMNIGESFTLSAIAEYDNGEQIDITEQASWSSSNSTIVSLSGSTVTAQASGDVTITVDHDDMQATIDVIVLGSVVPPEVLGLVLNRPSKELDIGEEMQILALLNYNDGTEIDVTEAATWEANNVQIAAVDQGLVKGLSAGDVVITAGYSGYSSSTSLTVNDGLASISELQLRGLPSRFRVGDSAALEVWAIYSDSEIVNVTDEAEIATSDSELIELSGNLALGLAEGVADLTLTFDENSAEVEVEVLPADPQGITPDISDNTLLLTEADILTQGLKIRFSDDSEYDYMGEISFVAFNDYNHNGIPTSKPVDDSGYLMLESWEDDEQGVEQSRVLRSGQFYIRYSGLSDDLMKQLDELNIDYVNDREAYMDIAVEVVDNPNLYQWNRVEYSYPEDSYFSEFFIQDEKVYFIWDMSRGNTTKGLALSVYDGQSMSEPQMLIPHVELEQPTSMINGGGNGYFTATVKWPSTKEVASFIFDLTDLESPHEIDFSGIEKYSQLPTQHTQGASAFDSEGNLILVQRDGSSLHRFHKYFPHTKTWEVDALVLSSTRIGQQLKHNNHLLMIDSYRGNPLTFKYIDLDTLEVARSDQLQLPQSASNEYCGYSSEYGALLALSLTDELEEYSVYCKGANPNDNNGGRLLWENPTAYPHIYSPERGAQVSLDNREPFIAQVGEARFASLGVVKNPDTSTSVHIDHVYQQAFETEALKPAEKGHKIRYEHVGATTARNKVVDTSPYALANPNVEGESVFIYRDMVSVWSQSNELWQTDEGMFGTHYLQKNMTPGRSYAAVIDGTWHIFIDGGTSERLIRMYTFQMRNPEEALYHD